MFRSMLLSSLASAAASVAVAAAPADALTLNAPATDSVMLLARAANLNLLAVPLEGKIQGEFPTASRDGLVRAVLEQVHAKVSRREDFIFIGREASSRAFPKVELTTQTPFPPLWERELSVAQLARLLSIALHRPIAVEAPADRETLTVVLSKATAEQVLAALAFFLGQPARVAMDGSIALGDKDAAVSRDCAGFSLTEWTRLSGYAPAAFPIGLLQTGGVSCPTVTGQAFRTADGDQVQALGPDDGGMVYRWVHGAKAGRYVRIGPDSYTEMKPCDDVSRESRLKHLSPQHTYAVLNQGLLDCAVSRNVKAGDFEIIDIDAKGPMLRNTIPGTKNPVVQITASGPVGAFAPVQTQ